MIIRRQSWKHNCFSPWTPTPHWRRFLSNSTQAIKQHGSGCVVSQGPSRQNRVNAMAPASCDKAEMKSFLAQRGRNSYCENCQILGSDSMGRFKRWRNGTLLFPVKQWGSQLHPRWLFVDLAVSLLIQAWRSFSQEDLSQPQKGVKTPGVFIQDIYRTYLLPADILFVMGRVSLRSFLLLPRFQAGRG